MIRYRAEDGLVSTIADDMAAIQDAVYQNIADRLGIIIKRHGIKGDLDHSFDLSYTYLGGSTFRVECSNVGPVIFGDYIYIAKDVETLSSTALFSDGAKKVIYLKRVLTYSNDQKDNFKPGHPVDENGNPPASGYKIESQYNLELGLADNGSLPVEPVVIIGTIIRNGSEAVITDLRRDNALSLNDFGLVRPNNEEIENFCVKPLFQHSIIKSRAYANPSVNQTPSQVNMTANKLYLEVSWSAGKDVYAYQVQLQILDSQGRSILYPISEIVPHIIGIDRISTYIEVTSGLKYKVSARILSSNPNHDPGPWVIDTVYAGVPDLTTPNVITPPELTVISVNGEEENTSVNHMVKINAVTPGGIPEPFYVQIFGLDAPLTSYSTVNDGAKLIYEGDAPSFLYSIDPGATLYFAARTVGPGGICSSLVCFEDGFTGSQLTEKIPHEFVMEIPIAFKWDMSTNPIKLTRFYVPAPYSRLKSARFESRGSLLVTTGDNTIGIEMVIDKEGSFPWLDGETNGKTANTNRKMLLDGLVESVASSYAFTQEEYYQGAGEFNPPVSELGSSWNGMDEITVWLSEYDKGTGTSFLNLSGKLTLTFERTAEEMV